MSEFEKLHTASMAEVVATRIMGGSAKLCEAVAEYGRAVLDGADITENHRRYLSLALSQVLVTEYYREARELTPPALQGRLLRQIALHVYFKREGRTVCSGK